MTLRASPRLPYGRHSISADDRAAVDAVLRSDWLTTGPAVDRLEEAFSERLGASYAVSCSSGTAALHLATLAAGLGPGDTAIVPTITFVATANAARYVGAEVVFADVDPTTGLMTSETLSDAAGRVPPERRAMVMPVHLAGQSAEIAAIRAFAHERGWTVVEDACHAIGSEIEDQAGAFAPVGACAHSDMAVFSLHPVKTITSGEGGVVTTNSEALRDRLRRFREHGIVRSATEFKHRELAFDGEAANPWYYEQHDLGFNYRASDLHCALGLSQLGRLDAFRCRRRMLAEHYTRCLHRLAPRVRPLRQVPGCRPCLHLYVVRIDFDALGMSRGDVMRGLSEQGIGTQVHYIPVHLQPYYRKRYGKLSLPGAMEYYRDALSLPLFDGMDVGDVERVVDALERIG